MAAKFSSIVCKILLVVVAMVALLSSAYARDDSKYGQCFSRPDCSNYCKNQGYQRGGELMPPNFMDCCCFI
ncbi:hypothetical protein ZWY2020_032056 [Hordeum vulgare]|nr:hypothetical protein ZWY2020_032056 [Hordeum vulgare]